MTEFTHATSGDVDYDGFDLESLAGLKNYQRWIVRQILPFIGGRVTEIGAGTGSISAHLAGKCDELTLVEPSARQANSTRERFAGEDHISVITSSLEDHIATLPDDFLDAVVMVNVLEHIDDDGAAVRNIRRALRPGGHLLIMVPALPFLFSKMDVRLGHFRRYEKNPLNALLTDAGFEIAFSRYMDILGVLPWWLINTLGGKTEFDPFLVRVYDLIFVPLSRLIETIIRPPLGKNIVLAARNPVA